MTGWSTVAVWGSLGCAGVGVAWFARRYWMRSRVRNRLAEAMRVFGPDADGIEGDPLGEEWLGRWLYLAGVRDATAVQRFLLTTGGAAVVGLAAVAILDVLGVFVGLIDWVSTLPSDLGFLAVPVLQAAPWLLVVVLAGFPYLWVQQQRRKRVGLVERELTIVLELLASLAQAGLGFDAAVRRVVATLASGHPLAQEFEVYEAELRTGRGRVACLRRVARRLDVPVVTRFVAAIVQAEQMGSGLTQTLRSQADDLRNELRERALSRAQALPSKLVFPLVICFLPGVFIATLGPAFSEFLQETERFVPSQRAPALDSSPFAIESDR